MTGRTHVLAGVVSAVAFLTVQCVDAFGPRGVAAAVGGACLGALLPNVDRLRSMAGRGTHPPGVVPSMVLPRRGPAHSLVVAAAACAGASWLCVARGLHAVTWFAVLLGYLSHLVLDALTPGGVPFFWPLRGGGVGLPLVDAGSGAERLLSVALLVVLLGLAWCGPFAWVMWNWLRLGRWF